MADASAHRDDISRSSPDAAGSMSVLLHDWAANEQRIAERLNGEFFPRLRQFAQRVLRGLPGAGAEADDVVQSALKSLCLYMRQQPGRADTDRGDVWRLLCRIAARKASRRRQRQTRGLHGGKVRPFADFTQNDATTPIGDLLLEVPPDEFDLSVQQAVETLDDSLQPIALMVMEGRTQEEISQVLGCSRRTVIRKFELIKVLLRSRLSD